MSVRTAADDELQDVAEHLRDAQQKLAALLFDDEKMREGEYSRDFADGLFAALTKLREVREVFRDTRFERRRDD